MHSTALDWDRRLIPLPVATAAGGTDKRTSVLLLHLVLTGSLVGAGLLERAVQLDWEALLYPSCVTLTLSFLWILGSWLWLRGTLFEPYPLFMTAAGLFNGGQAFLEVFHLNPDGILGGRSSPETLVPSLYLVTISLLATHAGALCAAGRKVPAGFRDRSEDSRRLAATRMVGWALLAVAAVPAFQLLRSSLSIVLDYGYVWLYRRDESIAVTWALTGLLVPGIIFLLAGAKNNRGIQGFCLVIAAVYALVNLFLGARAAAVMSAVSIAWVFDRVGRRISRGLVLALAVLALVMFSWVRETRATSGRWRLSMSAQMESLVNLQNPIASSISEMGYSLVAVTHTLALVPSVRDFDRGISYLYAASAIVPNLGWDVHPGKAHGLLCDWITQTVEPLIAASGGGLGYSFIAEAYLNFGWAGGPLCLLIVGYLVSRLFLLADGADPARQALAASFLCSLFVFVRGESAIVIRGLVWYAVVPYLLVTAISVGKSGRQRA